MLVAVWFEQPYLGGMLQPQVEHVDAATENITGLRFSEIGSRTIRMHSGPPPKRGIFSLLSCAMLLAWKKHAAKASDKLA